MNRITAMLALAGLLSAAPMAASATEAADCQALITSLQQATADATFIGRNAQKDEDGLVRKLGEASIKLERGKVGDAAQKVSDYQSQLMQLVNAGKISQETFDLLNFGVDGGQPGADDVQACIADIGN